MSFETRKQDAEKSSGDGVGRTRVRPQKRLINDGKRAWMLARDLAEALDNLLGHARSVQHGYLVVVRRRLPAAEWIIGDGHYASVARCGTDVAASLKFASAKVNKVSRSGSGHAAPGRNQRPAEADPWAA